MSESGHELGLADKVWRATCYNTELSPGTPFTLNQVWKNRQNENLRQSFRRPRFCSVPNTGFSFAGINDRNAFFFWALQIPLRLWKKRKKNSHCIEVWHHVPSTRQEVRVSSEECIWNVSKVHIPDISRCYYSQAIKIICTIYYSLTMLPNKKCVSTIDKIKLLLQLQPFLFSKYCESLSKTAL